MRSQREPPKGVQELEPSPAVGSTTNSAKTACSGPAQSVEDQGTAIQEGAHGATASLRPRTPGEHDEHGRAQADQPPPDAAAHKYREQDGGGPAGKANTTAHRWGGGKLADRRSGLAK